MRDLTTLRESLAGARAAEPHLRVSPLINFIRDDLAAFAKTCGTRDPYPPVPA